MLSDKNITYKQFGLQAILIEWPAIINDEIFDDILVFKTKLLERHTSKIVDVIQGYNSLTLVYTSLVSNFNEEVEALQTIYKTNSEPLKQVNLVWEIPVCYDLKFGIDLQGIALQSSLKIEEVIELHTNSIYKVYFIGFLPGFLYLGGLNEQLHFDRKPNPRLRVPKGAVAIGGKQTGIYPNISSGGWNIIGNTPIDFFDIEKENPCFAKPGDFIKFRAVSLQEYNEIVVQIKQNKYELINTLHHA